MYNLVKRQAEVEILPMAEAEQIGVISYSPLGGGLLTGKYGASARDDNARGRLDWDEKYKTRYGQNWMHDAANGLMQMANEAGVEPATLAVAWVAQHNAITSPIISARNEAQLRPSLAAASFEMSNEIYDRLSDYHPALPLQQTGWKNKARWFSISYQWPEYRDLTSAGDRGLSKRGSGYKAGQHYSGLRCSEQHEYCQAGTHCSDLTG